MANCYIVVSIIDIDSCKPVVNTLQAEHDVSSTRRIIIDLNSFIQVFVAEG